MTKRTRQQRSDLRAEILLGLAGGIIATIIVVLLMVTLS
jgi:hypothetical protein